MWQIGEIMLSTEFLPKSFNILAVNNYVKDENVIKIFQKKIARIKVYLEAFKTFI